MIREKQPDYYRLLDVRRDAPPQEIHTSYRALARAYHPDRNSPAAGSASSDVSRRMTLVNEAYACLKDAARRRAYDRSLKVAEPLPLQMAVLNAAEESLLKAGWRSTELQNRDWIFEKGVLRVGVRFVPAIDQPELERWVRWANVLSVKKTAEWSVALACRILAVDEIESSFRHRIKAGTIIDLTDARAFGRPLPHVEYQEIFGRFLMDSK